MLQAWPTGEARFADPTVRPRMDELQAIVVAVRNTRNQQGVADGTALAVTIATPDMTSAVALTADRDFVLDRGNLSALAIEVGAARPAASIGTVLSSVP